MVDKSLNEDRVLNYKNQDPFFIDYYKYRAECIESKSLVLKGQKQPIILALAKFLDYTCDYVTDYEKKFKEIEDLLTEITDGDIELKDFRERMNKLWLDINKDHVLFEILPKPNYSTETDEIEKFWKEENHKGLRELKKVQSDIFKYGSR